MLTILMTIIALGIILEVISLRRDPDMLELDYEISTGVTEPGAPVTIRAVITNNSRLPVSYLALREIYPIEAQIPDRASYPERQNGLHIKKVCRIGGRQRRKLVQETSISRRGVYHFKGNSIELGDFLGFSEMSKDIYLKSELVVYPDMLSSPDLTETLSDFCGDVSSKRFLIRDPMLTVGFREYTGREPMKEIHWLQSARQASLMVREFDYNRQLSVCVILGIDTSNRPSDDILDRCCAAARTVCETVSDTGAAVQFFTNSVLLGKAWDGFWRCEVSPGSKGGLLEGLGRASSGTRGTLDAILDYARRSCSVDSAFVVILPSVENEALAAVNRLRGVSGGEVLLITADSLDGGAL